MIKLLRSLVVVVVACAASMANAQQAQAPANGAAAAGSTAPAAANGANIEAKVAMCVGCHGIPGYHASFPEVYRVPLISGQSGKYIAAALHAYKNGDRKHPSMRGIAGGLSDQDIEQIAAYYEKQGRELKGDKPSREPDARVAALLQKAACASCHGANFATPIDPSYPRIAGQYKDYLFVALKAYKTENNPVFGRSNGIMGGIAKQFTNAELKALADYIGSLEGDMIVQPLHRFR